MKRVIIALVLLLASSFLQVTIQMMVMVMCFAAAFCLDCDAVVQNVFCDEDGTREFKKSLTCPACQTVLSNKFEIVRNNLQPSEQYKAMILAGMRPDMICDIASRALSFWEYQSHQEKTYLDYMVSKFKDRTTQIEQSYEKFVSQTTAELNTLKSQLSASKKDVEDTKKKYNEMTDRLNDRNRQLQKLQSLYDRMRRKLITTSSFENQREHSPVPPFIHKVASPDNPGARGDNVSNLVSRQMQNDRFYISTPSFEFNPRIGCSENVPVDSNVQKKFSVGLGTPRQ